MSPQNPYLNQATQKNQAVSFPCPTSNCFDLQSIYSVTTRTEPTQKKKEIKFWN